MRAGRARATSCTSTTNEARGSHERRSSHVLRCMPGPLRCLRSLRCLAGLRKVFLVGGSDDSARHARPRDRALPSARLRRATPTSDELRTMRAAACRDRVGGGLPRPTVWQAARYTGEASRSQRNPSSAHGLDLQSSLLSVTRRLRAPFGRRRCNEPSQPRPVVSANGSRSSSLLEAGALPQVWRST